MTSQKKKANGGYKVPEYENETKRTWNIMLETTSGVKIFIRLDPVLPTHQLISD